MTFKNKTSIEESDEDRSLIKCPSCEELEVLTLFDEICENCGWYCNRQ